jgi:hypothetical protein
MQKVFRVTLTEAERAELGALIRSGRASARTLTRARILLKADQADDGRRGPTGPSRRPWTSTRTPSPTSAAGWSSAAWPGR